MEQVQQGDIIDRAIETAVKAHRGQKRKGTEIPYITHPFSVAVMLAKAGCSDEMIAAAILHDTVEDTSINIEFLREEFGDTVAFLVENCSEPPKSLPWEVRKEHSLKRLKHATLPVRLISCADKLHNIQAIARDANAVGDEIWHRFNRGKDKQTWYYKELVNVLCNREDNGTYEPIFQKFREEVEKVFGKEDQA